MRTNAAAQASQTGAVAATATTRAEFVATGMAASTIVAVTELAMTARTISTATAGAAAMATFEAPFAATSAARDADRTSTAIPRDATRSTNATSAAATSDAIRHPPPTPANAATLFASMTAESWSKATSVAASRQPGPAPTFDISRVVGNVGLDLPLTLGALQGKLAADSYGWHVSVTDTSCKGNLETLTADGSSIQAKIYCDSGRPVASGDTVAEIVVSAPFGGTLKGVSVGSTRADVVKFLRGYNLTENFDTINPPELRATIQPGRTGGPAGQYLAFTFNGTYTDFSEKVTSISLHDARFTIVSFPVFSR